jgi:hypothetical protein
MAEDRFDHLFIEPSNFDRAVAFYREGCYVPDSQRNLRSEFLTYIEGKERDFVGEIARRRG